MSIDSSSMQLLSEVMDVITPPCDEKPSQDVTHDWIKEVNAQQVEAYL